jgi:F-type H+-transporting ATPase subunit b
MVENISRYVYLKKLLVVIAFFFSGLPVANPPKTFFWQYFGVRPPVPTIPFPDMPADFKEHPDRDLVNYPYPAKTLLPYPTRWVLFPVSWCDAFYPVTGVSGMCD